MPVKSFSVSLVQADFMAGNGVYVSDILRTEHDNQQANSIFTYETGGYAFQLSDITVVNRGQQNESFQGVVRKLRLTNLPELGSRDGSSEEIDLGDYEGLVEKNYFLFFRRRELLVYQNHKEGTGMHDLGLFFSEMADEICTLNPILKPDAYRRLINNQNPLTKIEFSITKPNLELFNEEHSNDRLTSQLTELARNTNSHNVKITLGTPKNMNQRLGDWLKSSLGMMAEHSARTAKAWTEDDSSHPIDLIADRIKGKMGIEMNGHYPEPEQVFPALNETYSRHRDDINMATEEIDHSAT